ncbi:hypothetical protein RIR_e3077_jg4394.t1 [Rhizophagus irregularis DAOM 181602=DAOM 197198]|nr:hypothetical protein RIR_e3077_jg4394.t1 [Rhizophagus irregularis DAOM 181602=DAOM 197198]
MYAIYEANMNANVAERSGVCNQTIKQIVKAYKITHVSNRQDNNVCWPMLQSKVCRPRPISAPLGTFSELSGGVGGLFLRNAQKKINSTLLRHI